MNKWLLRVYVGYKAQTKVPWLVGNNVQVQCLSLSSVHWRGWLWFEAVCGLPGSPPHCQSKNSLYTSLSPNANPSHVNAFIFKIKKQFTLTKSRIVAMCYLSLLQAYWKIIYRAWDICGEEDTEVGPLIRHWNRGNNEPCPFTRAISLFINDNRKLTFPEWAAID